MEKIVQDSSGIVGLFNVAQAAQSMYYALHAMQHRGQDGCGLAVSDGNILSIQKGLGLLAENLTSDVLSAMEGSLGVGQVRMATKGDAQLENVQPIMVRAHQGHFSIVTNGMITNALTLRNELEKQGLIFQGTSDAELIAHLIQLAPGNFNEKIDGVCKQLKGSYAFLIATKDCLFAARDPHGIRPLFLAKCQNGYALSSETCSFGILGAQLIREINPGEIIRIDDAGLQEIATMNAASHVCSMEYVYFSRVDSVIEQNNVHAIRKACGKALAKQETVHADIVVGVPDSAISAATSFAHELKIPYETGLIKNRYIGSTFIRPTQQQRMQGLRVRLNAISSVVKGKKVFLVDDCIVKGSTAKRIAQLLKEAGATEVHLRIASPMMKYPCLYGNDHRCQGELVAYHYTCEEMEELFHVDSLRFLDIEEYKQCVPQNSCMACFDGVYPEDLADFKDCVKGEK